MDVVYPYKKTTTREIEYSIKLLRKFYPDLNKIWVIGDEPPESVKEHVIHIFHSSDLTKWGDSTDKIRRVALEPELTDDFLLFNDDFFLTSELKPAMYIHKTLPTLESLAKSRAYDSYVQAVYDTIDFLEENGLSTYNFGLHIPMKMNKMLLNSLLANIEVGRGLLLRSVYGNSYITMSNGSHEDVKNIKLSEITDYLSTSNVKFNYYRRYLDRLL